MSLELIVGAATVGTAKLAWYLYRRRQKQQREYHATILRRIT